MDSYQHIPLFLPGEAYGQRSLGPQARQNWSDLACMFTYILEKEMATHSSVLAWRTPGTGEPGGLPSLGSHRVGHDWSDIAAAAAYIYLYFIFSHSIYQNNFPCQSLAFKDCIFSFWIRVLYLPWGRVFEPCNYWYLHLGVDNSLLRWTVLCITKCLLRGKTAPPFESHCPNKTPTLATYIIFFLPL